MLPPEDAVLVHQRLETGHVRGKLVLKVDKVIKKLAA
jgi:hypothetical protein